MGHEWVSAHLTHWEKNSSKNFQKESTIILLRWVWSITCSFWFIHRYSLNNRIPYFTRSILSLIPYPSHDSVYPTSAYSFFLLHSFSRFISFFSFFSLIYSSLLSSHRMVSSFDLISRLPFSQLLLPSIHSYFLYIRYFLIPYSLLPFHCTHYFLVVFFFHTMSQWDAHMKGKGDERRETCRKKTPRIRER